MTCLKWLIYAVLEHHTTVWLTVINCVDLALTVLVMCDFVNYWRVLTIKNRIKYHSCWKLAPIITVELCFLKLTVWLKRMLLIFVGGIFRWYFWMIFIDDLISNIVVAADVGINFLVTNSSSGGVIPILEKHL